MTVRALLVKFAFEFRSMLNQSVFSKLIRSKDGNHCIAASPGLLLKLAI